MTTQQEQAYDLRIQGGRLVDPANGVADEVRDIWVRAGKVVPSPTDPGAKALHTIDARGYVVMAAGVDVHCHIAGSKVNGCRLMRPEEHREGGLEARLGLRSGTLGSCPTSFATGYQYTGLGYGTALDASIPPLLARLAHQELADTPLIDKAFLLLMGNNHLILDQVKAENPKGVRDVVAWLLGASKGFGVKVVNPGGVERWKLGRGNVATLDDVVEYWGVSPRQIMTALARAIDELELPHPMHLHGLNLGIPGNGKTTLETMKALDGHRAHLAHIQFHSYGDEEPKTRQFGSAVPELASYLNERDNISVDVGQVVFGETTSMTADSAVGQFLAKVTGRKWLNVDVEAETGCGVVPITYSDKNAVHALQWAVGLEWFLAVSNPWKLALSTDHPNGGSFLTYPRIIAWLMSRARREETLNSLPQRVRERTGLGEFAREYSLAEVAIVTRAAPARMLGLTTKGHLGPGADADVTIYSPDSDHERMFSLPRWVIKGGQVVVDDGELRAAPMGRALHVSPEYDEQVVPWIREQFEQESTICFENLTVASEDIRNPAACVAGALSEAQP